MYRPLDRAVVLKKSAVPVKNVVLTVTIYYYSHYSSESIESYDSIRSISDSASYIAEGASHIINNVYDFFSNIPRPNWCNNRSQYATDLYQKSLSMPSYNIVNIQNLISSYIGYLHFSSFSPLDFRDTFIGFHSNIAFWDNIRYYVTFISTAIFVVVGPLIISMVKKHGTRYDPVRDKVYYSANNESNNSQKSNYTNNSNILQGTSASGGTSGSGGGDDNGDRNNKKPNKNGSNTLKPIVSINTLIALSYIHERIISWRINNPNAVGPESEWYGTPVRTATNLGVHLNGVVSLAQIIRYAIANSHETVPRLGTPLRVILSESALAGMPSVSLTTFFRGSFSLGRALHNFLRDYDDIENLLGKTVFSEDLHDLINKYS